MGLLDFIFPKYCVNCKKLGSYLCANCFSYLSFDVNGVCLACNRFSIDGLTHPGCRSRYTIDGAFASLLYRGVVKRLIYNFKYKPYLTDLRSVMIDLFFEGLIQKEQFDKALNTKPVLVPIPLHSVKLKSRGYNQANILAQGLAERLNLSSIELLLRVKKTSSQVGLKRKERMENIKEAFSLNTSSFCHPRNKFGAGSELVYTVSISGSTSQGIPKPIRQAQGEQVRSDIKTIFLVDDVLTTGATLLEAARVLKKNGVKKVWGLTLAVDQ